MSIYNSPLYRIMNRRKEEDYSNPYITGEDNSFGLDNSDDTSYDVSNFYAQNGQSQHSYSSYNLNDAFKNVRSTQNNDDPYQSQKNKINTYSKKLEELGQEPEKPDTEKKDYGVLDWIGDLFNTVSTPVNVASRLQNDVNMSKKGVSDVINDVKDTDEYKKFLDEHPEYKNKSEGETSGIQKVLQTLMSSIGGGQVGKEIGNEQKSANQEESVRAFLDQSDSDLAKEEKAKLKETEDKYTNYGQNALKTAYTSLTGSVVKPFANDETRKFYDDNNSSVTDLFQHMRNGDYNGIDDRGDNDQKLIQGIDSIGANTIGQIPALFADEENKEDVKNAVGQFLTDVVLGGSIEGKFDIDDGGKALSYMKNIRNGNVDDAIKNITKESAEDAIKKATKNTLEENATKGTVDKVRDIIREKGLDVINDKDAIKKLYDDINAEELKNASKVVNKDLSKDADYIMKKANNLVGNYDFDGIKYLGQTVISKEKLAKLAQKNSTYYGTKALVTALNPLAGVYGELKGSTNRAVQRLAKGDYDDTLKGSIQKLRDKSLEAIYDNISGGKYSDIKKIGLEDTSKLLDSVALVDEMKKRNFRITKQTTDALKNFNDIKEKMDKEYGKGSADAINDVRKAIETPTEIKNYTKEVEKEGYNNEYVKLLSGEKDKYLNDLKDAVNKKIELNNQVYTGERKYAMQKKLSEQIKAIDQYRNAIDTSTVNYSKQIKETTKGMDIPEQLKKDENLNKLDFVLNKSTDKVAGYISQKHGLQYKDAYEIAKKYKIASDGSYKTLEKALGKDLQGLGISTKTIKMDDMLGKKDVEAMSTAKKAKEDLSRTDFNNMSAKDTKFAKAYQYRAKQKENFKKQIIDAKKQIENIKKHPEQYPDIKRATSVYEKKIDFANKRINELDEQLNKQIKAKNYANNKKERAESFKEIDKDTIDLSKQERKNDKFIKEAEDVRSKKTTIYDDDVKAVNDFKKKYSEMSKDAKISKEDIDKFVEETANDQNISDNAKDKIIDYLADNNSNMSREQIEQKFMTKNIEKYLSADDLKKGIKNGKIKNPQKVLEENDKLKKYLANKYDIVNDNGTIGGKIKYVDKNGKEVELKNHIQISDNKFYNNASKEELVSAKKNGYLYTKNAKGEFKKLDHEYNNIQKELNDIQNKVKKNQDIINKLSNKKDILNASEIKQLQVATKNKKEFLDRIDKLKKIKNDLIKNDDSIQSVHGKFFKIYGDEVNVKHQDVTLRKIKQIKEDVDAVKNFKTNMKTLNGKDNMFNFLNTVIQPNGKGVNKITDFDTMSNINKTLKNNVKLKDFDDNVTKDYYSRFVKKVDFEFNQIKKELSSSSLSTQQKNVIISNMQKYLNKLRQVGSTLEGRSRYFGSVDKINERGNAFYNVLDMLKGKDVEKLDIHNPISKLVNTKDLINVHTPYGTISFDQRMSPSQISKAFSSLNKEFTGVANNVSFVKNLGSEGLKQGKNVMIDISGKSTKATLSHEFGHIMDNPNNAKSVRDIITNFSNKIASLNDEDVDKLKVLIDKHLASNSTDNINTNLTSYIKALKENGANDYVINRETFAEMCSMSLHQDIKDRDKFNKILGNDIKEQMYDLLVHNNLKENYNFFAPEHMLADKEYEKNIKDLSTTLKTLNNKGLLTYDEAKIKKNKLNNLLDKGNMEEIEEFFRKNTNFKLPDDISRKAMFKADKQMTKIINNVDNLDDLQKQMYKVVTETMKNIGMQEKVMTSVTASLKDYFDYLPHIMNSDLKNNPEAIVLYNKLFGGNFLDEVKNVYSKSRKYTGSIDEINKQLADNTELQLKNINKLLEDNLEKIFYKRMLDHSKTFYDIDTKNMFINSLGQKHMNKKDFYDMLEKTVDGEGKTSVSYDKIEKFLDKLGIENKRIYPDKEIELKMKKLREINPSLNMSIIDDKDTVKNTINAYYNAYRDYMNKQLATGRYSLVRLNKRTEKQNIKGLSLDKFEKAINNKTDRIEDIVSSVTTSDINKMKDVFDNIEKSTANSSYATIPWKDLTDEQIEKVIDDGAFLMPKRAMKKFEEMSKTQFRKDKNAFLKVFDFVTSTFKSSALLTTKFHTTNAIGNMMRSYVELGAETFNPLRIIQASQIVNGLKKNAKINNGMTYKEVLDNFMELGGEEVNAMSEFKDRFKLLNEGRKDKSKISKLMGKINPLDSNNFVLYKASGKLGNQIENNARMMNFVYHLEHGKTPQEAMDLTNEILFDYSDLTAFETGTLKRLMPFYTFMRKNIGSQLEYLANKPREGHLTSIMFDSAENRQTDEEKALAPSYLTNGAIPLGNKQYLQIETPFMNLFNMTDPKQFVSASNPVIKSPIESILNRNFYNDSSVSKYNKTSEKIQHVIDSIIPIAQQIENFSNASKNNPNEFKRKLAENRIRKQWLGNVIQTYDDDTAKKQALDAYYKKLSNQYYEYADKHPEEIQAYNNAKAQKKSAIQKYYNKYYGNKQNNKTYNSFYKKSKNKKYGDNGK